MTDSGTATGKRPPSLWWFVVAAVIAVLGLVPFTWLFINTAHGIAGYEVDSFDSDRSTTVTVDGGQIAIFAVHSGSGTVRCDGAGPDESGPLERPSTSLRITTGSTRWGRVAVTPEDWPDGEYRVTCDVASPGPASTPPLLGYADNPSIMSTVVGFAVAVGIAILAGLVAATIAVVAGVKRYKANRPQLPSRPEFPASPPPPPPTY